MAQDLYFNASPGMNGPLFRGFAITPADSTDLAFVTRAIWVGTGGDVAFQFADGSAVTLRSVPSGTMLPVRAARVMANGTTASNLVGLY